MGAVWDHGVCLPGWADQGVIIVSFSSLRPFAMRHHARTTVHRRRDPRNEEEVWGRGGGIWFALLRCEAGIDRRGEEGGGEGSVAARRRLEAGKAGGGRRGENSKIEPIRFYVEYSSRIE